MSDLVELAKDWLSGKGITFWADWDVTDAKPNGELQDAAEWWVRQLHEFVDSSPEIHLAVQEPWRPGGNVWAPPTIDQHEIILVDVGDLDGFGPTNLDLPGTSALDEEYHAALTAVTTYRNGRSL